MQMGAIVREQTRGQNQSGRIHGQSQIRTNGRPQGSPVSGVPANYYSAPLLEIFAREGAQEHDVPAQNPNDTKRNNETSIITRLFVDDGSLYTASDSPTANARRLQKAFEKGG